jgi:hypothetical protein
MSMPTKSTNFMNNILDNIAEKAQVILDENADYVES